MTNQTDSPRVLIVDDDTALVRVLQQMLIVLDCRVTTAQNAHEAFVLLRKQAFDVLLTDIQMPGLSGYTVARVAHDAHALRGIIFMTGQRLTDVVAEVQQAGGIYLLAKPFRVTELRHVIDTIMTPV